MKVVKKNVYYCDYCKKKGLSSSAMTKHEKHCTGNIQRECRMCKDKNIHIPTIIKNLKVRFRVLPEDERVWDEEGTDQQLIEWYGDEITLAEIEKYSGSCPSCTLTIIRALEILPYEDFGFKYQEAVASWWTVINQNEAREYL